MAKEYIPYDGPVVTRAEALRDGLKWYFNGKPCTHGHLSQRRTSSKFCCGCQIDSLSKMRAETAKRAEEFPDPVTARQSAIASGSLRYFTGKPCKYGHVCERVVTSKACAECQRLARAAIPMEVKARHSRKWREPNPDRAREVWQSYAARHAEKRKQESRDRYAKNAPLHRARTKAWRGKNPEAVRAHAMTRWALKKGSSGSYNAVDVRELRELQRYKCAACGVSVRKKYHVDHIHPLSRGGLNERRNLQILCPHCNMSKHARDPVEWAQSKGRLL